MRALAHACHTMSSGAPSGAGIATLSFVLLRSLPVRGGCIGVAHALRRMVVCGGKPSLGVVPRGSGSRLGAVDVSHVLWVGGFLFEGVVDPGFVGGCLRAVDFFLAQGGGFF